ncbi:MAG: ureidoglycolate dehydrogenase [Spirochaetes bacterium]|nr:ureidoglycolate dehydrogenase [Spirochaetota bacterium]
MEGSIRRALPEELKRLTAKRLQEAGVSAEDAEIVADVLVFADLRGVHSHGVLRVEHYVNRIRRGGINVHPSYEVQWLKPSVGLLDAQGGLGHVSTKIGTEAAIEKARTEGIALVGIKNNSHCGALAYYIQMALNAKMASISCVHTDIRMVPYGGAKPYFGTNPFAFGFPGTRDSILLDMATSEIAWGKVLTAREKGLQLQEGWAVDRDGHPTTDPFQAEYLTPFGGPKGYGIAVMVEALTGLLIGGVFGPHLNRMYEDLDSYRDLSNFILVIDPAVFDPKGGFLERTQRMIEEVRALPPAAGFEQVMLPGEIESRTQQRYEREGIPIPEAVYRYLSGSY